MQNKSNNQILDKEEAEVDKIQYQTSVFIIISSTTFNGGIPKLSTLKNKNNIQDRMDNMKLHITHFYWSKRRMFGAFRQEPSVSCTTMS